MDYLISDPSAVLRIPFLSIPTPYTYIYRQGMCLSLLITDGQGREGIWGGRKEYVSRSSYM